MRQQLADRADRSRREVTAYLVVGDVDLARRLAARATTDTALAALLSRERGPRAPVDPPADLAGRRDLAPRERAFWWWWRQRPAGDRLALAMASRHGWWYADLEALLEEAATVLGCPGSHAWAGVTAMLDPARPELVSVPSPSTAGHSSRRRGVVAAAALGLLLGACIALAGPGEGPETTGPAARTVLLPRPLARPIANYESLAPLPGHPGDLPERGLPAHERSLDRFR